MIRRVFVIASGCLALAWLTLAVVSYALVCLRGQWGVYTFPLFRPTGVEVTERDADGTLWCLRDEHGAFTTDQVGPKASDWVYVYSPGVWLDCSSTPSGIDVFVPTRFHRLDRPGWAIPYTMDYNIIYGHARIGICFWFPITVFSIAPLTWFVGRLRRRRRRTSNLCVTCGYNLTGNTSGTCPECGRPVPMRTPPGESDTRETPADPR
jgi:hypothetical protein